MILLVLCSSILCSLAVPLRYLRIAIVVNSIVVCAVSAVLLTKTVLSPRGVLEHRRVDSRCEAQLLEVARESVELSESHAKSLVGVVILGLLASNVAVVRASRGTRGDPV